MKKYVLVLILFTVIGCKKNTDNTVVPDPPIAMGTGLPGTWELRSATSGATGFTTFYSSGNGNLYILTADTYQTFSSGTLLKQGKYAVVQQYSAIQKQNISTLVFDGVMGNPLS